MCNACIPILVGVVFLVLELKFGETSLSDHGLQVIIKTFKKGKV